MVGGISPTDSCIKCKSGLYKIILDSFNCYYPYEISNNYYKDTSVDHPIFKLCYDKYNTSSELGNDDDKSHSRKVALLLILNIIN